MLEEQDRPITTEELLARLPDIPHTASYKKDAGSLAVPYKPRRKGEERKKDTEPSKSADGQEQKQ